MSVKKLIIGVIVVLVIIWIGYLLVAGTTEAPTNIEADIDTELNDDGVSATMPLPGTNTSDTEVFENDNVITNDISNQTGQNIVTYTDNGFSPKTLTVKEGESVIFVNQSSRGMWVASAVHPTHEVYPEFDGRQPVPVGGTYSFTFDRVGEWKYHNHVGPADTGSVIVE